MLPTLTEIFKLRGQIRLTEKMKGNFDCYCSLCSRYNGEVVRYDPYINNDHYATIKLFIPKLSKSRFKFLQKTMETSLQKKDAHRLQQKTKQDLRLYPLPMEVYDNFAKYLYTKFGEPQFKKKKKNLNGANWGPSMMVNWHSQKHGMWVHKRTVGVGIHRHLGVGTRRSAFRFYVDNDTYYLPIDKKDEGRKANPMKFKRGK